MKYRCLKLQSSDKSLNFWTALAEGSQNMHQPSNVVCKTTYLSYNVAKSRPKTSLLVVNCISPIRPFAPPIIRRKLWPWCGNHSSYSKWRDNYYANVSPHLSEDLLAYSLSLTHYCLTSPSQVLWVSLFTL